MHTLTVRCSLKLNLVQVASARDTVYGLLYVLYFDNVN